MRLFTILFALACVISTPSFAETTTKQITERWGKTGFTWQNRGKMLMRFAVFDEGGTIQVCMAYSSAGGLTSKFNRAALEDAKVQVNGTTVLRNLNKAKAYSSRYFQSELVGQPANCVMTKASTPSGSWTSRVNWRSGRYKVDR